MSGVQIRVWASKSWFWVYDFRKCGFGFMRALYSTVIRDLWWTRRRFIGAYQVCLRVSLDSKPTPGGRSGSTRGTLLQRRSFVVEWRWPEYS